MRVGHFLSPYGIWNVDHGSPAIIPVTRPYTIGNALIPQYQTGIELHGAWNRGGMQLGYHLTLSNGRGPVDTYQDLDHNKALGARLFVTHDTSVGTFSLGASGYRGDYSVRTTQGGPDEAGEHLVFRYLLSEQYKELSLAADLKWEWDGLLLQAEAMLNDVAYSTGYRPPANAQGAATYPGPPGLDGDYRRYGMYGLIGYRTPFWGIMPYVFTDIFRLGATGVMSAAVRGGLNVRSTPRVVLKAEFFHLWFPEAPDVFLKPGSALTFQVTWGF